MVSTYNGKQPTYLSEGRLSRVKSGSTGALHTRSRMSMYNARAASRNRTLTLDDADGVSLRGPNSRAGTSRLSSYSGSIFSGSADDNRGFSCSRHPGFKRDCDYIYTWCHHYGLSSATAQILFVGGVSTSDDLLRLDRSRVGDLAIAEQEKLLFRGALLQFKQSDYELARQQAAKGLQPILLDKNHGVTEEERQKRAEMRQRIRRKKLNETSGVSLADRILMQRREANSSLSETTRRGSSNLSLPVISQSDLVSSQSGSARSFYTDPTPRRCESYNSLASKFSDNSSVSGSDYVQTPRKSTWFNSSHLKSKQHSLDETSRAGFDRDDKMKNTVDHRKDENGTNNINSDKSRNSEKNTKGKDLSNSEESVNDSDSDRKKKHKKKTASEKGKDETDCEDEGESDQDTRKKKKKKDKKREHLKDEGETEGSKGKKKEKDGRKGSHQNNHKDKDHQTDNDSDVSDTERLSRKSKQKKKKGHKRDSD